MSDERRDAIPPQPPTVQLPQVPAWAVELTRSVKDGFAKVEANLGLVASDLGVLKGRVENLESARALDEKRANEHSIRVRGTSENDMRQDAAISTIVTRVGSIEKAVAAVKETVDSAAETQAKTAETVGMIHAAVTGIVTSPKVKFVGRVIFSLAMAYAAAKGIKVLP